MADFKTLAHDHIHTLKIKAKLYDMTAELRGLKVERSIIIFKIAQLQKELSDFEKELHPHDVTEIKPEMPFEIKKDDKLE